MLQDVAEWTAVFLMVWLSFVVVSLILKASSTEQKQ